MRPLCFFHMQQANPAVNQTLRVKPGKADYLERQAAY